MITARSPNGYCVTYNDAGYLSSSDSYHSLYKDSDKTCFIARIPIDWVVEYAKPCWHGFPDTSAEACAAKVIQLLEKKDGLGYSALRCMKRLLRNYNAKQYRWK